jgi:pyruvate/2-oxoglutarate/acetoin dehydrogenase E1 component
LIVPAQISPLDWTPIEGSVATTGSLLTVEEGTAGWSWGTEVAAVLGKRLFGRLRRPIEVLASSPTVIPSAKSLEREMLVGASHIKNAIREAVI